MSDETRREIGKKKMEEVYGWPVDHVSGTFLESTIDHLFAEVWTEGKLSVRDRRLMLIGMAAGNGAADVAGLQLDAAMRLGELDAEDLRSIVLFIAHYGGWPQGAKLNMEVEKIIANQEK